MQHRKSRNAYIYWGRFWIVVTFIILRAVDVAGYVSCYEAHKSTVISVIINSNILSIVLLTGIWYRQIWARYILVALLLIWLALAFAFTGFLQEFFAVKYGFIMAFGCAGYIAATLILIASPSIQKLTSRSFG